MSDINLELQRAVQDETFRQLVIEDAILPVGDRKYSSVLADAVNQYLLREFNQYLQEQKDKTDLEEEIDESDFDEESN